MLVTDLSDGWTVRAVTGDVPLGVAAATVSGDRPGMRPHRPARSRAPSRSLPGSERSPAAVGGRADWRYETTFPGSDAQRGERTSTWSSTGSTPLRGCELNGVLVAETRNMHRTYRFDVGPLLQDGENELAVDFALARQGADQSSEELGRRPHVNHHPYNAIRKMACNFGWDWGPDLATAGIWKPASLESWSRRPGWRAVRHSRHGRRRRRAGRACTSTSSASPTPTVTLPVAVTAGRRRASGRTLAGATVDRGGGRGERPALWWPRGLRRAAPLRPARRAAGRRARPLATRRIGFRSVELRHRRPTTRARRSCCSSTGDPVLVKGANWIPDDCFPHRVDPRAVRRAGSRQSEDAGINLLRVWGGGIFESDDFYDVCDEPGILVWQDFLFACAAYAEEEPLRGEIVAEITRQRHPADAPPQPGRSGTATTRTSGATRTGGGASGSTASPGARGYYYDLLPALVAELDPTRPVLAGKPLVVRRAARTPTTRTTARCTSGTSGTARLHGLPDYRPRGSSPSSAGRAHRPGRP